MDRIIRTTTEYFLNKLDDDRQFFTPDELRSAGFPEFLVNRIRLELMRNLQDSVTPPDSDWANMQADSVRESWSQFLQAIHEEVRLPASFAGPVLESSIGDILEMLVAPRAFLPDYLFGSESELGLDNVRERCEWIVVYTYFSRAIPRFMEKKGRETLTREQAGRIIQRLDDRITAHYTSLNWAQLFEPWFDLIGERIDTELFARFFRDKGLPGVAYHFEAESDPINRTKLIELLSRPQADIDDLELPSQKQQDARGRQRPQDPVQSATQAQSETQAQSASQAQSRHHDHADSDTAGKNVSAGKEAHWASQYQNTSYFHISQYQIEPSEEEKREALEVLGSRKGIGHRFDEKEVPPREEENILARFQNKGDETAGSREHRTIFSHLKTADSEDKEQQPLHSRLGPDETNDPDAGDIPIWKRFSKHDSDSDAPATPKSGQDSRNDDDTPAIIDLDSKTDDPVQDRVHEIRKHVSDMESEFVDELFGGDENAFLEALDEIAQFDTWKKAGTYITRDIFNRNLIDIYSDTAINFTDRMQTYFLEKES